MGPDRKSLAFDGRDQSYGPKLNRCSKLRTPEQFEAFLNGDPRPAIYVSDRQAEIDRIRTEAERDENLGRFGVVQ